MKETQPNDGGPGSALQFLCRHLVCLAGFWRPLDSSGEPSGEYAQFCYPGIILSVRGKWVYATAGHTIRKINDYSKYEHADIQDCKLLDYLGPEPVSQSAIPFNYSDSPQFTIYDQVEGLDFGLLALNSNQQQLLMANNIVPVTEADWVQQEGVEFDSHILLGLPDVFMDGDQISPTIVAVNELDELPDGVEGTQFPRFVGKLDSRISINIEGMSGGPIFGFEKGRKDKYWIVALQSSWLSDQKITFGCPIRVFGRMLEELLNGSD